MPFWECVEDASRGRHPSSWRRTEDAATRIENDCASGGPVRGRASLWGVFLRHPACAMPHASASMHDLETMLAKGGEATGQH